MAEREALQKRYAYQEMSNKVEQADRSQLRNTNSEPTGEVESLKLTANTPKMGDRSHAISNKDKKELIERKAAAAATKKRKRQHLEQNFETQTSGGGVKSNILNASGGQTLLDLDNLRQGLYQPTKQSSRAAYESLLQLISSKQYLGSQPSGILHDAANEILSILKSESYKDPEREREISLLLTSSKSKLGPTTFSKLVKLGKTMDDYFPKDSHENEEDRDEMGVAVVFDEDDSEDEDDNDDDNMDQEYMDDEVVEVVESSDEEEEEKEEEDDDKIILKDADTKKKVQEQLNYHSIDAHWLQRQLSRYYNDAQETSTKAKQVLEILHPSNSKREVENKLLALLGFDLYPLLKLLLKDRMAIWACVTLKQTGDDKKQVERELLQSLEGKKVWEEVINVQRNVELWTKDRMDGFQHQLEAQQSQFKEEEKQKHFDSLSNLEHQPIQIDLDSIKFHQGSHLMSNKKCHLPSNTFRAMKKSYEEVHVPAKKTTIPPNEKMVMISDMPQWTQPAFKGMTSLNRIQSKMYNVALFSSENLLLCAPTGAGKTNVAMMTMLNVLSQYRSHENNNGFDLQKFKIVYIAPMKALVQEITKNFTSRLKPFNLNVKELSGDASLTRKQIAETQVIITTPEKWDIVTRQGGDGRALTQFVKLVIIDEIHLLHDDRGAVLEAIISRTIRHVEQSKEAIRLVGLSATLPNYTDVATLLRVNHEKGLFFFDFSYRPVPLQMQYIGITEKNAFKRMMVQNELCYERALKQRSLGNQMLIFVHSRGECGKTAKALRDLAVERGELEYFMRSDGASSEIVREEIGTVKHADLKEVLQYGFAIHHAGMSRSDRELVEDLFADRHIGVLCCTATLAWGVNLPAHCVIIKGTQVYSPEKGKWIELSPLDVLQMLGRAGRPQFDTEGEGIIMTNHSELQYYLSLTNLQLPVESQLIKTLPEHLNAEIVLGNIQTLADACDWLSYSFLFIRMLQNPTLYGIIGGKETLKKDPTLKQRRLDLCHSAALLLEKSHLIRYEKNEKSANDSNFVSGGVFHTTPYGRISSQYYITHTSMAVYNRHMTPTMSDIDLLRLFSLSGEFTHITVREEEKLELSKLVTKVPIPIKESPNEPSAKVNILLQAYISRLKLEGLALIADMIFIHQSASRIMRALFEISLRRNWANLTKLTLNFAGMISHRIWKSQSPLRQISNVPEVISRKLERKSDIEWYRYFDLTPTDLGELIGIPKMGRSLYKLIHEFPKLEVTAHVQPITRSLLRVELTIVPDFEYDINIHGFVQFFHIWVEDVNGKSILHYELFVLESSRAMSDDAEQTILFTVPILDPLPPVYFIRIFSDRWLHCETVLPISFSKMILPSKFAPPTELLDLQPMSISSLPEPFRPLYSSKESIIKEFNPIQTQTFHEIFKSNHNVFVAAPTGSGKTICAEFAILRMLSTNSQGKCVYVAPKKEIIDWRQKDWKKRFGQVLLGDEDLICTLTGETAFDLRAMNKGKIILATLDHWDAVSRRWKQRKVVQAVTLFIADDVHFLGGNEGPTYEVILSRMRYMSNSLASNDDVSNLRIVALSASIANAKDVADWLGVSSAKSYFHFPPKVRPVPLEIYFQSFDQINFSSRLLAMSKPVYTAVMRHSLPLKRKLEKRIVLVNRLSTIIFVPSKRQVQLTAIDLMAFRESMENGNFLGEAYFGNEQKMSTLQKFVSEFRDVTLRQVVIEGIGYVYEGMHLHDLEMVLKLYNQGALKVLICPSQQCWNIQNVSSQCVIIMGTEGYDGREKKHVDFPISDLLHMMGKATRQTSGIDPTTSSNKCVILCHSPKKDHLKKLLYDPLPIESHLDHYLHDHFNSEIVTRTITSMQDAVDYITWTFLYRRLTKNPNYYNLQGTGNEYLSEFLSDMVEMVLSDLEESKCCQMENDGDDISPLNLGMIAAYYYIQYTTVELMSSHLTAKIKTKGIMEIISAATEFSNLLPIRTGEEKMLKTYARNLVHRLPEDAVFNDSNTKALILLQSHFSRTPLSSADLRTDQRKVIKESVKLVQAIVDVISSNGWLKPALAAMELSQMIVQGQWNKDNVLMQIPHFNKEIIERCVAYKGTSDEGEEEIIESVFDILTLDDNVRNKLLGLSEEKMADVAVFCNNYPSIDVSFQILDEDDIISGEPVQMTVQLEREVDDEDVDLDISSLGVVSAPLYPEEKREAWWIVVGDTKTNSLLCLKRVSLQRQQKVNLEFVAPDDAGDYTLTMFCMSDSYLGCDQEFEVPINVAAGEVEDDEEDEEDEDEEEEEE